MPRDLHRLAAPAVFCNNVRRPYRRRRSPRRNVSRQRDRLLDDREYEYDDYAAEIASYNRLRRGDRNAATSTSSTPRHTYESLSCYDDFTGAVAQQSDARCLTSHLENADRLRVSVPGYHQVPYVSDEHTPHDVSRLENYDSQHRKHKKKRTHHHCHSRKKEKHNENGLTSHPPRDTIAALKALADYGETNHGVSSVSPARYYGSPSKSQRKGSYESKSPTAVYNTGSGSEVITKTEKAVTGTVNASSSSPNVDCTRDSLSLGECTDDEDDEPVDTHATQRSHRSNHSLPHIEQSEHHCRSSTDLPPSSSSAVSSSVSTKKIYCGSIPRQTGVSTSMQLHHTDSNSRIPNASSASETKAHREQLPTKHDKSSSDRSEGQSVVRLKHSPVNKETSVADDRNKTVPDGKRSTQHKSQSSTLSSRKKSAADDDQRKTDDDASVPRFVTYFCR